jgi:NCS1 family nucleobase:cation symporter-1
MPPSNIRRVLNIDFNLGSKELSTGGAILAFLTAASLVVAYFSTLMLNFCDFSRFSPSERMVKVGNLWGLPVNFTAFSLVTVVVTAGSVAVFGEAITDPVEIVAQIPNTLVLIIGAVTFAVATIGINIVANFVSPAYDLANALPKYIDFKRGGLISALLALLVTPWNIYNSPVAVNYFLGGLGAFLGPLFGIIIVDYYLVKREQVDVEALYREGETSPYWYEGGINRHAVWVFVISAAVAAVIALVPAFSTLAPFSWFVGAGLSGALYWATARRQERAPAEAAQRG